MALSMIVELSNWIAGRISCSFIAAAASGWCSKQSQRGLGLRKKKKKRKSRWNCTKSASEEDVRPLYMEDMESLRTCLSPTACQNVIRFIHVCIAGVGATLAPPYTWLMAVFFFFFFFTHPIRSNKSAGPSDCLLAIDWISVALQGLALAMETRIKRKPR